MDKRTKLGTEEEAPAFPVITKGGLKEGWTRMRKEERYMRSTEEKRVVNYERKARVLYVHYRTGKGNLQSCQNKLDDTIDSLYRFCGNYIEIGKHIALICAYKEEIK